MDTDMLSEKTSPTSSPFKSFESPSSSPLSYQVSSPTTSTSSLSVDVVHQAFASKNAPTTDIKRTRKRWSEDINKFIWRTYLIATKLHTNKTYLDELHEEFTKEYPNMQASRQRLGDQCRAIIRNKLLTQDTLDRIKKEVTVFLQQESTSTTRHSYTQLHNSSNREKITSVEEESKIEQTLRQTKMKWTTEYNEMIMRSYYRVTNLGTNETAYRKLMHEDLIKNFPPLGHLSEQRIVDQRRSIIKNKYINNDRLDQLKKEISEELALNTTTNYSNTSEIFEEVRYVTNFDNTNTEDSPEDFLSNSVNQNDTNFEEDPPAVVLRNQEIDDTFQQALQYFKDIDPLNRNYIPRQKSSKKLQKLLIISIQ